MPSSSSSRPIVPANFKPFTLGMIQLGEIGPNKLANLAHARSMVRRAAEGDGAGERGKAQVVMLPEIFNSPTVKAAYKPNAEPIPEPTPDAPIRPEQLPSKNEAPTLHMLSETARETGVWLIGGSIPECRAGEVKIWNTATVWDPAGNLVAKHQKVHLYDCDFPGGVRFKESDSMSAGTKTTTFTTPYGTIALGICFDIRFGPMLTAMLAREPEICAYLLPSAFNMSSGPRDWELLQRCRAVDCQIYVGMCSPARDTSVDYVSYGHTLLASPSGEVISSPTPEDEGEAIVFARLEPEAMRAARQALPLWCSARPEVYGQ